MGDYRFSRLAEADLDEIAGFTVQQWDREQADRYLAGLEALCRTLASGEHLGRACPRIGPDLFRVSYVSHVVFFRRAPYGVRIVRVLHKRQLPELHELDDEDTPE